MPIITMGIDKVVLNTSFQDGFSLSLAIASKFHTLVELKLIYF